MNLTLLLLWSSPLVRSAYIRVSRSAEGVQEGQGDSESLANQDDAQLEGQKEGVEEISDHVGKDPPGDGLRKESVYRSHLESAKEDLTAMLRSISVSS